MGVTAGALSRPDRRLKRIVRPSILPRFPPAHIAGVGHSFGLVGMLTLDADLQAVMAVPQEGRGWLDQPGQDCLSKTVCPRLFVQDCLSKTVCPRLFFNLTGSAPASRRVNSGHDTGQPRNKKTPPPEGSGVSCNQTS
jgi:hypothetical protein